MITIAELANQDNLNQAWGSVYAGKKAVAEISQGFDGVTLAQFKKDLTNNIRDISTRLLSGSYQPIPVKVKLKEKRPGKFRRISMPSICDRVVQRTLLELLKPQVASKLDTGVSYCLFTDHIEEPKYLRSAISKIVEHVKGGNFHVFESDIVGFYDNIPKDALWSKISSLVDMDAEVAKLFRSYIYYDTGNMEEFAKKKCPVPHADVGITQGSPLSPMLANLYLVDLDNKVKTAFGDRYVRYVDDFVVMCADKEECLLAETIIRAEMKNLKLDLAPSVDPDGGNPKTNSVDLRTRKEIIFLGLSISSMEITFKGKLSGARQRFDKVLTRESYKDLGKDHEAIAKRMNGKIAGWGRCYSYYHTDEMYRKLDTYIVEHTKWIPDGHIRKLTDLPRVPLIDLPEWQQLFKKDV